MGLFFRKKIKGIKETTFTPADQYVGIIEDSLRLMNDTLNPDTFMGRYKLATSDACKIRDIKGIKINGVPIKKLYEWLSGDKEKIHRDFIDRLFAKGEEDRFVFQMFEAGGYLSEDNKQYFVKKLKGKKYHFCQVIFTEGGREYTYVAKDRTIQAGDMVSVPTGNGYVNESKLAKVVATKDIALEQLQFPVEKLRCVEGKFKSNF